jgi:hypothetical protein
VKVPLHAQHGIPEVWLFDLQSEASTVYLDPTPQGFRRGLTRGPAGPLSPSRLPSVRIDLAGVWR